MSAADAVEGTIDGVLDWVGDDPARAREAYLAEVEGKNRSTLLARLDAIANADDEPEAAAPEPEAAAPEPEAAAPEPEEQAGPVKYLFGKRVGKMGLGCYGCHRLGDKGSDIGPDLNEEGDKVKKEWLIRWFKDPESHIPGATMGDFHFTEKEIKILTDYLMTFKRETAKAVVQPLKRKVSLPRG